MVAACGRSARHIQVDGKIGVASERQGMTREEEARTKRTRCLLSAADRLQEGTNWAMTRCMALGSVVNESFLEPKYRLIRRVWLNADLLQQLWHCRIPALVCNQRT